MSANVLYHEFKGNLTEERDLVIVTLTRWEDGTDYRAEAHYTLKTLVFVDGEDVVNKTKWMPVHYYTDPSAIRTAIAEFDSLVEAHPSLGKE